MIERDEMYGYLKSIKESLAAFTGTEYLGQDNMLHCEQCKTNTKVSKQTLILDLPKVLIIQLKRFVFS